MCSPIRLVVLVSSLYLALAAPPQPTTTYELFDVPGAEFTVAWGINPSGEIVGTTVMPGLTEFHGFLRDRNGKLTTIDAVVPKCTSARGITPSGEIVGFYQTKTCGGPQLEVRPGAHGFLRRKDGSIQTIDVEFPGTQGTIVTGINPAGDLVGVYLDGDNKVHGFVRRGGQVSAVDVKDATATLCRGINAGSEIVGRYDDNNKRIHGFLRKKDGTTETIDVPGATSSIVGAVNRQGDIVGRYVQGGTGHGFLREAGGQPVNIDVPKSVAPTGTDTDATGISPSGVIVGTVTLNENGKRKARGFIRRKVTA